jgi:NADH-quinone oxidoreductase subunit L
MDLFHFHPEVDFPLLLAVPAIPLLGYVLVIFFGRSLPRKGDWLVTGGMFLVMAITVLMAIKAIATVQRGEPFAHHSSEAGLTFSWLYQEGKAAGDPLNVTGGILFDGLSAAMLAVVGIVSFFVHLFSIGYMHGDRRYHVFFANISLFTVAMLGLVLADNILFLFVFWELMGLMSYLLIGHFAHDPASPRIRQATSACKKAFLTTRVGDTCLLFGMIMFWAHFKTLGFTELWEASRAAVAANGGEWPAWMTIAGLALFGGTVGKSAQFPLHIWLPDAMEGPTPVSAMIHAATMVAAGVFLLGRVYPMLSPEVLVVVTVVGTFTALFAATIGTTVNDVKGVLAYSTISQLGFMVAAIGLGGVVAGTFHMVTHAFFKACLFLCAGSVIHGCHHEQDMRRMGGLRKLMPVTFACMLASTLAIAGIPLFAGFYSKDMIVLQAMENSLGHFSGASLFAAVALPLAALLTAFYMFRLICMTFAGEYRGAAAAHGHGHDDHGAHDDHGGHGAHAPHESPWPMTVALCGLATLAVLGGHFWLADGLHAFTFWEPHETWYQRLVSIPTLFRGTAAVPPVDEHVAHQAHSLALGVSLAVALGGILIAWLIYGRGWERSQRIAGRIVRGLGEVYTTVAHKYWIDELVDRTVVRGTLALASAQRWIDEHLVDGLVNLVGAANRGWAFFCAWFDRTVVDGLVNFAGLGTQAVGSVVRLLQTGRVQQYVSFAVAGGLAAAAWLILS